MFSSYAKNFAIVALITFVMAILLCTWGISTMSMDKLAISDCASQQSELALCGMNLQGHLAVWQNFLDLTPQRLFEAILAVLLFATGFFVGRSWFCAQFFLVRSTRATIRKRLAIVDPIKRALSRGIIQPQIYEFAVS